MKCEDALLLLSGHLDGENTTEEEAALRAHLDGCASCRALLAEFEAADRGVAALEAEPPKALYDGVMGQIRRRRPARRYLWGGAAAAAVLAVLLAAGRLPGLDRSRAETAAVTARTAAAAPAAMSSDQGAAALTVELVDDPAAPAADTIAALSSLTVCQTGDDVEYWTDAETARSVIRDYGADYDITAPADLARAADDAPCAIRIVTP